MRVALQTAEVQRERCLELCRREELPIDPKLYWDAVWNWEMLGNYEKALHNLEAYVDAVDLSDDDKESARRLREAYQKEIERARARE